MPSVLDHKWQYNISIKQEKRKEIERFLTTTIGPRNYILHSQIGGKQWALRKLTSSEIEVCVDDEGMATLIALKYA